MNNEIKAYKKIAELLSCLREKKPLIHHITNYVTANDCANITLAIGASPVMADDINEVRDMTALASSLVINIGTINQLRLESMLAAAHKANELGVPVILDPVGVGATPFRIEAVRSILGEVKLSVLKGNLSEIKTIYGINVSSRGVDSTEILEADNYEAASIAKALALQLNTIIVITGEADFITDGKTLFLIKNGHALMSKVTGTGCMCTSLIASYLGAGGDSLVSALAGVVSMGIAGDIALERLELDSTFGGSGSLKVYILDAIYRLSEDDIKKKGKIYEI